MISIHVYCFLDVCMAQIRPWYRVFLESNDQLA
jgi:hypothetical protein